MKELKDERMLADFLVQTSGDGAAPKLNLRNMADQLLAIANELRGDSLGGGDLPEGDNSTPRHLLSSPQHSPDSREIKPAEITSLHSGNPPERARSDQATIPSRAEEKRESYANTARVIYATRRQRATIFANPELFGEPAWDILLDLYIAHAEGKPVSVSSACIGSAAPPTTGLRWLGLLADNDLVLREHDPEDQRRVLVRLTETGLGTMDTYFANREMRA